MPELPFRKDTLKKPFSPELLVGLAERFKTSITSTVYRYLYLDLHPILVVMITHGKMKYFSKSPGLYYNVKDIKNLDPPSDSVAQEYIEGDYEFIYNGKEKTQEIFKSTWFNLKESENDSSFYEYCIPTKQYETIVSVVWER